MLRLAVLVLGLLPAASQESEGPVLRVLEGSARLHARERDEERVRELDPAAGALRLAGPARLEAGAVATLELVWRGRASVTVEGPAAFALGAEPRLLLERFRQAEVEVRRGALALELEGHGTLELGSGVLRVRSLPRGGLEILNRGASPLELQRGKEAPLSIPPGRAVRLVPSEVGPQGGTGGTPGGREH